MSVITGQFVWQELHTSDLAAATAFYTEVAGWTASGEESGTVFRAGGDHVAAAVEARGAPGASRQDVGWVFDLGVDEIDAVVDHALRLGAAVRRGPVDVPGIGSRPSSRIHKAPSSGSFSGYPSGKASNCRPLPCPGISPGGSSIRALPTPRSSSTPGSRVGRGTIRSTWALPARTSSSQSEGRPRAASCERRPLCGKPPGTPSSRSTTSITSRPASRLGMAGYSTGSARCPEATSP